VFENIIEQEAVIRLRDDILAGRNAPSMLFYGPGESGKGSAALELSRVLSCNAQGAWKCSCGSCERQRILLHDDLLVFGRRSFAAEIAASCSSFLRNSSNTNAKTLFYRSIRKLLLRFSPVLMEDEPKLGKISTVLQSLDEGLSEFWTLNAASVKYDELEKICKALVDDALTLEREGISSVIPINHIRRAAWWCRVSPAGKRKTLIIENAQNMRDEARNSLLKLLEEPPSSVNIVLTVKRREEVMPTILSRLRPYRFLKRSEAGEKEIIRRIFQDTAEKQSGLSVYLESFLPQSAEKMHPLAAWFLVSLARAVISGIKKTGGSAPAYLNALGERYAQIAESAGLERTISCSVVVKTIIAKSGNFAGLSFSGFMKLCIDLLVPVIRGQDSSCIAYNDIFKKYISEAVTSVEILNINAQSALEALFYKLKTSMIRGMNV